MPIVIDGYNLLRAVQKTEEDLADLIEAGLCRIISEYLTHVRDHGHIYFDGIGPPDKTRLGGLTNLEVYFTGKHIDADSAIEQKILDNTAPKSLIVVSSDRRIKAAARKRKANPLSSEIFWQDLITQLGRNTKPSQEPKEKRQGLTEKETDQWLDAFGLK